MDIEAIGISVDTSGVKSGARDLDALGRSADQASRKADNLGVMYDRAGRKITDSSIRMAKATEDNERAMRSMEKGIQSAHASMLKFYALIGGGAAIGAFLRSVVNAEVQLQKLNNTLKFSTGSAKAAAAELEYLRNTTQRLGLEFTSTASAYSKFTAAAKGTSVEGQKAREIFESVAKASTVMGLSAEETEGALRAIQQMISKGTVASEELRGQLGERLPGAFQIAARAMGVTTMELGKMLEQGQVVSDVFLPKFAAELTKTLGENPDSAAGSALAQLNRLSNAWTEFKTATAESGVMTIVLKIAEGSTNAIKWFDHFVFGKGELADLNRAQGLRDNLRISRERRANLENSFFASDSEKLALDQRIRELEVQINPALRNTNAIPGMPADMSGIMPLAFGSQTISSTGKETGGGYGGDINKLHQRQAESARQHAQTIKQYADATRALEESERSRMKQILQDDERMLESGRQLVEQQKDAIESLKKQAMGWDEMTLAEQAAWDIQNGRFKDFDAQSKEEILRLTEMIDLKQKITDLEKSNMEDARRIEDDMVNETLAGIKKRADEQAKMWESIDSVAHDTFVSIFDSGKNSFDRLRDTLKNGLYSLLYQMTIKKWIINVSAAVSGGSAGGAAAGDLSSVLGGGGSGSGGLGLGSIKSIFDVVTKGFDAANNLFLGAINDFGASVANMGGVFSDVGGWIGQYSGTIAAVAPFVPSIISILSGDLKGGIASGIGAGIGYAVGGPIGGAIGSALGSFVGGLFGKKSPPMVGSQAAGTFSAGKYVGTSGQYGKKDIGAASSLNELNKAFATQLGTLLKAFGLNDKVSVNSIYRNRTVTKGFFGASFDGGNFYSMISKKEDFQTYINKVLGQELVKAIQMSKLPDGIRALFSGMTDKTQVTNMIQASMNLNSAQEQLAERFGLTVNQAAKVSSATGSAGDSLIAFVNNLAGAANAFKTIGDVLIDARDSMTESFAESSGGGLPATLKAFDDVLKGIDKTTQDGIEQFAELFAIRDQFNQYVQSIDALKGGVKGSLFGIVSPAEQQAMMQADLAQLFGALNLQIPGSVQELINLGKSIDYTTEEGLNLAAAFPSLVQAFQQAREQTNALTDSLQSLDISRFATLVDYTRAVRYAESGIDISKLPSYDVGTSFVPQDGPAMIHQGERIMTRSENAALVGAVQQNAALSGEIKALREEIRAGLYAVATNTGDTAKRIRQWDGDGMPAERVIA